jgi:hypothetical protein
VSLGLNEQELQEEIARRLSRLDEAQEDADQLGQYGELLRITTMIAYQRAADLITANNTRLQRQLRDAGIEIN